jgi:hypothetical protein
MDKIGGVYTSLFEFLGYNPLISNDKRLGMAGFFLRGIGHTIAKLSDGGQV